MNRNAGGSPGSSGFPYSRSHCLRASSSTMSRSSGFSYLPVFRSSRSTGYAAHSFSSPSMASPSNSLRRPLR